MSYRVPVKNPKELSVPAWSVWDATSFNAVADLTPVSTWVDINATGRDLAYVGTVKNPFISTERLNGNKVIECDAVDSRMQLATPTMADFSFSVVRKLTGPVQAGYRVFDFGFSLRASGLDTHQIATPTNVLSTSTFSSSYGWNVITITKLSTTITIYVNGIKINSLTNSDSLYTAISAFGDNNSLGASVFMKTYIAEINTFTSCLSEAEVKMNQRYLKFKWGI